MQPTGGGGPQFPLRSTDCEDRVISFVVGGYKRHSASTSGSEASSSAFETDEAEQSRPPIDTSGSAGGSAAEMWRTAVPNQHVDEQTKRNYVLEVSRRLNLTRREMASAAHIEDFRYMNYWIRGKESAKDEVKRTGALLYSWAVSTDSRVAVPMSREEEDILRKYQAEKQRVMEDAQREKHEKALRTQQARAEKQREKQQAEAKLRRDRDEAAADKARREAAAVAASASASAASASASAAAAPPPSTTMTTKKRARLVTVEAPVQPAVAAAAAAEEDEARLTAGEEEENDGDVEDAEASREGAQWSNASLPPVAMSTTPGAAAASTGNNSNHAMTWESPRRPPAATAAAAAAASGKMDSPPLRSHRQHQPQPHSYHHLSYHMLGSSPMLSSTSASASRSSYEDTPTRMNSNHSSTSAFPTESPLSLLATPHHPLHRSQQQPPSSAARSTLLAFTAPLSATPLRLRVEDEGAGGGSVAGGGMGASVGNNNNHHHHPLHLATSNLLNVIPDVFHGHDLPDATPTTSTPLPAPAPAASRPPDPALPRSSARKLEF